MTRFTPTIRILLSSLATISIGCHGPLNDHDGLLGAAPPLPAIDPGTDDTLRGTAPKGEVVPIDRSDWSLEVIVIEQGQVEAQPSYGSAEPVVQSLDRASLRWPTPDRAVETRINEGDEAVNALLAPLVAAGNLVIFPGRACIAPPWSVIVVSPDSSGFELMPTERTTTPWNWVRRSEKEQTP